MPYLYQICLCQRCLIHWTKVSGDFSSVLYVPLLVRCSFGFCFLASFGLFLLKQHLCSFGGAKSQGSFKVSFSPLDAQSCLNQKRCFAVGFSFVCVLAFCSWWSFVPPLLFLLPRPVFSLFFPFLGCLSVPLPRGLCLQPFGFRFSSVSSGLCSRLFLCLRCVLSSVAPGCTRAREQTRGQRKRTTEDARAETKSTAKTNHQSN